MAASKRGADALVRLFVCSKQVGQGARPRRFRLPTWRYTVLGGAGVMLASGLPWPGPCTFAHGFFRRARCR